jgi:tetratricopeptide (TPR) repeat protein
MLGRTAAQLAEGRIGEAIAQLDAILDEHPLWLDGQRTVVRLRWLAGERDSFTSSLEKALAAAPRNIDLWRDLIDSFMRAELYDKVLATIAQARARAGPNPVFDAAEAVCAAERGDTREADRLFAALGAIHHITLLVRYVRHLLRSGRPAEAAAAAEARLGDDPEHHLLPYLAAAWRLLGDPRWEWLEGDPRLIGVYDIADRVGSLDALADRLRALHLTIHQPLDQTLRGGTQTDGALFARIEPEIRALRQAIVDTVATHVAQLPPHDPAHPLLKEARGPVRFAGSWSVRLSGAGYHINHVHPAGWISSAFYVALPERGPDEDRHAGWLSLGEVTELGLDLPPIRLVEPRPGRLVLFPSTMWHGTRPFAAGERLTVAFDVARPDE